MTTPDLPANSQALPSKPHASWWGQVWQRFRVRPSARWGFFALIAMYAVACYAPFVCNQKPLYWCETTALNGTVTTWPLLRDFLHPENGVDLTFNLMAVFWTVGGLAWGVKKLFLRLRRQPVPESATLPAPAPGKLWRRRWEWILAGSVVAVILVNNFWAGARYKLDERDYYSDHLQLEQSGADSHHAAIFSLIAYGPNEQIIREMLQSPSWSAAALKSDSLDHRMHWLGTDDQGRDLLARLVHGTRISLSVGFVAVGISLLIGLLFGALAGFYGGWVDMLISRFIEIVICFPTFFLIMLVLAVVRHPGIYWIMLILGLTGWPGIARLVRGEFLKLRNMDYVAAARALGQSDRQIILRHILPNSLGPVYVAVSFGVAGAVLLETGLSFLGIGVQPPTPSWGEALNQARSHIESAWWLVTFPGCAILATVLAFNLVGDGLRDAFDPRGRAGAE